MYVLGDTWYSFGILLSYTYVIYISILHHSYLSKKSYNLRKKFWIIISESNWISFLETQWNKQAINKRFFFLKWFLGRGSTNSTIDIHKFNLKLSHLFGTTSLDSCSTQNQIFIENKRVQIEWDIVAHFFEKRDFDCKDSKWIF